MIFGKLVSSSSRQVFGKELSYEPSGKREFLGLLGTEKGHNILFVMTFCHKKGEINRKISEKRKRNIVSKRKVQNK